jgi:hypothetical protein
MVDIIIMLSWANDYSRLPLKVIVSYSVPRMWDNKIHFIVF